MITRALTDLLETTGHTGGVAVEIFVPQEAALARRTLNTRLGIIGDLSILDTTWLVKPLSHDAYTATIDACLSVARAVGLETAVLTTGRRSERIAQSLLPELPAEAFVQIGDFFQNSLNMIVARGFRQSTLAVFFGKALKMAQGTPRTHASRADLNLEVLESLAAHQASMAIYLSISLIDLLALEVARITAAGPVIITATDLSAVLAIDLLAQENHLIY